MKILKDLNLSFVAFLLLIFTIDSIADVANPNFQNPTQYDDFLRNYGPNIYNTNPPNDYMYPGGTYYNYPGNKNFSNYQSIKPDNELYKVNLCYSEPKPSWCK